MSKLKCSYWDSSAFSLVLFWMKNNACPPPPNDLAKVSNEQRKEKEVKRQDWKGKRRACKSVIGPDLLLCGLPSPSVNREEGHGDRIH